MINISRNKIITYIMAVAIIISSISNTALAKTNEIFSDIEGHWAQDTITRHAKMGMLKGYPDGTFKPDQGMKRCELISLINRYFGLKNKSLDNYRDIDDEKWYAEDTARAKYYNYIKGLTVEPNKEATRNDVIQMLTLILDLEEQEKTGVITNYSDINDLSKENKKNIEEFSELGYVQGFSDGEFKPNKVINRAEILTMAESILGYIVTSQEDLNNIPKDAKKISIINPNMTIKNLETEANIYISPGVNGKLTIKDSKLAGKLEIAGGTNENPIQLENVQVNKLIVTKTKEKPIVNMVSTDIKEVKVKSEATINTDEKTIIRKADVKSKSNWTGEGKIYKISVDSKDVKIEKKPQYVEITDKKISVTIGNKDVTYKTDDKRPSSGGSSTSSKKPTKTNVTKDKVSSITVKGEGNKTTITDNDGTLQMSVEIKPTTADNKEVTWSVNDKDIATISDTGLLTAVNNGTVTVTATAKDGSGIKGQLDIEVTGQVNISEQGTRVELNLAGKYIVATDQSNTDNPIGIWKIEDLVAIGTDSTSLAEDYVLMNYIDFNDRDSYRNPDDTSIDADGDSDTETIYNELKQNGNTDVGFKPIGVDEDNKFSGSFNGNNNKINHLYINRSEENNIGLFGYTETSIIKDVSMENSKITGRSLVGGLIGANLGEVRNCYNTGRVEGEGSDDDCVGGLIGGNAGTVSGCYNTGSVEGLTTNVGGLIGYNVGEVSGCYNTGSVKGKKIYVGGLIGYNDIGEVRSCYNTGRVEGSDKCVGGLIGGNSKNGNIISSYSIGKIDGIKYVGGLIGRLKAGSINNCIAFTAEISGESEINRLIGDTYGKSDTMSDNYAYSSMKLIEDGTTITITDGAIDNENGANITEDQFRDSNDSIYSNWDFTPDTDNTGTSDDEDGYYWQMGTDRPLLYWYNGSEGIKVGNDNGIITEPTVIEVNSITVKGEGNKTTITDNDGTLQMSVEVEPTDADKKEVTWSVNNESIATISDTGLLTAVNNGTVTVTATAKDGSGIKGQLDIEITGQVKLVNSITVKGEGNKTTITDNDGTLQMSVEVEPTDADKKEVTWSVNNESIATISDTGLLTAVNNGTVTVTATAKDGSGIKGQLDIEITGQVKLVNSITVKGEGNKTTITDNDGTLQMSVEVEPTDADKKEVAWSVNDESIATISDAGLLTAVNNGTVIVTATAKDGSGIKGQLDIEVTGQVKLVNSITVKGEGNKTTITDNDGTLQMSVEVEPTDADKKEVAWSVNDESIATISDAGLLTAVNNGTVIVTATAKDGSGIKGQLDIEVTGQVKLVNSITVKGEGNKTTITDNDGTLQMSVEVEPTDADKKEVTWSVNNESIATISDTGLLTAVNNGTVTVTATAKDGSGIKGQLDIEITGQLKLVNSITVKGEANKTTITDNDGTLQMSVEVEPTDADKKEVAWSVNDESIATITDTGLLTAVNNGTVTVTATAKDGSGIKGQLDIEITGQVKLVNSITVKGEGYNTKITEDDGTLQMSVTVKPTDADNKEVTWSVNDKNIATITDTGLLTAVNNGTVTVIATAKDGSDITGELAIEMTGQKLRVENDTTGEYIVATDQSDTNNPIGIWKVEDLVAIGRNSKSLAEDYVLMNDIDFDDRDSYNDPETIYDKLKQSGNTDVGFEPIGSSSKKFTGSFNGNGNKIDHLYINRSTKSGIGLFGYTDATSIIENVSIENCKVIGGRYYTGGLIGNNKGKVTSCYSIGSVEGKDMVGGLIGLNDNVESEVNSSYSTVNVKGEDLVGGLIGYNEGEASSCYSTGRVEGVESIGGLLGRLQSGKMDSCIAFNTEISTTNPYYINRLMGYKAGGTLSNNYANSSMTLIKGGTSSTISDEDGATDNRHGANITEDQFRDNSDSIYSNWDFTPDTDNTGTSDDEDGYYWQMGTDRPLLYWYNGSEGVEIGYDDGSM